MAQRTRSTKRLLKPLHTWTGIIAGFFVSLLGLTGSLIVFRDVFDRAAMPNTSAARSGAAPFAALDDAAREVHRNRPDAAIRRVKLPVSPDEPYIFQVESEAKKSERIVADPGNGRVAGTLETGWIDWVVDLHHNFLTGKSGRKAVGIAGISLFLLSASGLLMWLRGPRNWRAWVTVRPGPARRFHFELHRAAGLWAYVLLAVISFTGIGLAFPDTYRQAVLWATHEPPMVKAPKLAKSKSKGKAARNLSEYLATARAAMPDGVPVELRLSETGKSPVEVRLHRTGDLGPASNHVYLDPASGAVISVERIVDRPAGARLLAAITPIHYAQIGGLPLRIVWSLVGLVPAILFVTGLFTWWRPAMRKPSGTAAAEADSEVNALVTK